eukprot:3830970-Prymnesium_polylepis.1
MSLRGHMLVGASGHDDELWSARESSYGDLLFWPASSIVSGGAWSTCGGHARLFLSTPAGASRQRPG